MEPDQPILGEPIHLESVNIADDARSSEPSIAVPAAHKWLYITICMLVDQPTAVWINTTVRDRAAHFMVSVAPSDLGKVIGKVGRNARALRTLFVGMGKRCGLRFEVEIENAREARDGEMGG